MFAPPPLSDKITDDPIRLADWVELNLLLDEEPVVSITSLTDELSSIPPDDARESESRFEYEDPETTDDGEMSPGYRETAEQNAEAAFAELSSRAGWLNGHYPLEIAGDVALLRERVSTRDVYRFLVLLRSRQMYQCALNDDGNQSGYLFEELVKHALGEYIGSEIHQRVRFGLAGGSRGDGLPKPLAEAVQELCKRMGEKPGQVTLSDQGDFKADTIAWRQFGDDHPGQLVLICQATISEGDWMQEEPANRWTDRKPPDTRLVLFFARPITAVAFPETLSLTPPEMLEGLTFSSIPFDRLRLLSVLSDEDLPSGLREDIEVWSNEMRCRLPK